MLSYGEFEQDLEQKVISPHEGFLLSLESFLLIHLGLLFDMILPPLSVAASLLIKNLHFLLPLFYSFFQPSSLPCLTNSSSPFSLNRFLITFFSVYMFSSPIPYLKIFINFSSLIDSDLSSILNSFSLTNDESECVGLSFELVKKSNVKD